MLDFSSLVLCIPSQYLSNIKQTVKCKVTFVFLQQLLRDVSMSFFAPTAHPCIEKLVPAI